jgi:hypothetical protein
MMAEATLNQVFQFFKSPTYNMTQFSKDWKALPEKDRADLKKGIGDGTLDY